MSSDPGPPPGAPVLRLPVAEAYDRWAGRYDEGDNPLVAAAERVVADLAPLAAGRRVVEFGCGTGRNLGRLAAAGAATLTGLDLSLGMLEKARARVPTATLLRHDMTRPAPLPDASADLVLFCLALEHLSDLAPPLREARRLLAPGGEIVVLEIHPALAASGIGAHFHDGGTLVEMPTFAHTLADYESAFAAAGLGAAVRRDWRAGDFGEGATAKMLKRGPDGWLLVEFRLR